MFDTIIKEQFMIDIIARNMAADVRGDGLTLCFRSITLLGSPVAFIFFAVLLFFFLIKKGYISEAIILDAGLVISWLMMKYLKNIFGRERPPGEHLTIATGMSFPSGHAMLSTAFYGFIAYVIYRYVPGKLGKIGAVSLILMVLLVGISRIYLNVHYASDVIAGFVFGTVLLLLMVAVHKKCGKVG